MTRTGIVLCFALGIMGCSTVKIDPIELVPADGQKADAPGSAVFGLDAGSPLRELHIACRANRACSADLAVRRTVSKAFVGDELYVASVHVERALGGAVADFDYYERRPTHDNPSMDSWVLHGAASHAYGITLDENNAPRIYLRSDSVADKFVVTVSRADFGDVGDVQLGVGAVWR